MILLQHYFLDQLKSPKAMLKLELDPTYLFVGVAWETKFTIRRIAICLLPGVIIYFAWFVRAWRGKASAL